jgi:hypothetical protein
LVSLLRWVARELEKALIQNEEMADRDYAVARQRGGEHRWAGDKPRLTVEARSTRWLGSVASETPSTTLRQKTSIRLRRSCRTSPATTKRLLAQE